MLIYQWHLFSPLSRISLYSRIHYHKATYTLLFLHAMGISLAWKIFLCSVRSSRNLYISKHTVKRKKICLHSFLPIMDIQFILILFFLNVYVQFLSNARNFNISKYSTQYAHLYLYVKHKPSYQKIIRWDMHVLS